MDPVGVVTLKRPSPIDYDLCIFCQNSSGKLCKPRSEGIECAMKATETRRKSKNTRSVSREVIDRLSEALSTDPRPSLVWHKSCYSGYTHKGKPENLQPLDYNTGNPVDHPGKPQDPAKCTHVAV